MFLCSMFYNSCRKETNFIVENNILQKPVFVPHLFKIDIVYFAVVEFSVRERPRDVFIPFHVTDLAGLECMWVCAR